MNKNLKKAISILLCLVMLLSVSCTAADSEAIGTAPSIFTRPTLTGSAGNEETAEDIKPSVPSYKIEADLSNVVNKDLFYFEEGWDKQLAEDGFYVLEDAGAEFYQIYEENRYGLRASFITVDSLMHNYHLYFSYLMKKTEKEYLFSELKELTDIMLSRSKMQRADMEEAPYAWKEAADRNVVFFAVGKALLDPSYNPAGDDELNDDQLKTAQAELSLIDEASGISPSPLMEAVAEMEDYSQYKPRGYYDTDEDLKLYFKAMMWYGRRNFAQKEKSTDRSALLMTSAMAGDAFEHWEKIYAVTSFFAGESDDNGICEYEPLIYEAYGIHADELNISDALDETAFEKFHELTGKLEPPAINSVPMMDDEGETDKAVVNKGFRFMGQRFSIDASIFTKLIYSNVKENKAGDRRMLPDALDVPAALGSSTAEDILKNDLKAAEFEGYEDNLKELQTAISDAPKESWNASLYSSWINTLRPLLDKKGEGYPFFMQSDKWARKDLECFLGSYTELKHDTVLYSKQVIAEMGGGDEEIYDDRGYVEPEPVVFSRFSSLSKATKEGLKGFSMLSADAEKDLDRLTEIADTLRIISEKELKDETPTDDEFEFIRIYGGELEHFWHEAYKDQAENPEFIAPIEFPAPLVADIATDPDGSVLEVATGEPAMICVVVPVDGILRIARGSVYSFYEFTQPIGDRLTDHEWRVRLGLDADDEGNYHWEREDLPEKPEWTSDYRVHW